MMPGYLLPNKNGFTMIEFLFAVCILTIGMLGLLETANMAMRHDTSNKLRTYAISIADRIIAADRTKQFTDITSIDVPEIKNVKIGETVVAFNVTKTVTPISSGNTVSDAVTVSWNERGLTKTYSVSTYIGNINH